MRACSANNRRGRKPPIVRVENCQRTYQMSAQSRYERYWDNLMDADLAETIAADCCEKCGRELVNDKCEKCDAKREEEFEKQQPPKTMTTDTLFNIEPTKPTKLEQARRALADAERELAKARESVENGEDIGTTDYERAVDRFAVLVAEEEKHASDNRNLSAAT